MVFIWPKLLLLSFCFLALLLVPLLFLIDLAGLLVNSNLSPNTCFNYKVVKKVSSTTASKLLKANLTPWYYHTIIRFIEHASGRKTLFQFYPFVDQAIDMEDVVRYQL
jgi:hypothetical protein